MRTGTQLELLTLVLSEPSRRARKTLGEAASADLSSPGTIGKPAAATLMGSAGGRRVGSRQGLGNRDCGEFVSGVRVPRLGRLF